MNSNTGIIIKNPKEIEIMKEGGKKLAKVKNKLFQKVKEGVSAGEIDKLADELIEKEGGKASFKMVPGYEWATCVNINEGVVHGIPKKEIIFKKGDIVSVDVGMFYKGFHTDTSFSLGIDPDYELEKFLSAGMKALAAAISRVKLGGRVYDISEAIEATLSDQGYVPIRALVGHGIGKALHEEPQIPCFTNGERSKSYEILEGAVFAIEVMYSKGNGNLKISKDGWTISTSDGKISGLFEDTIAVTKNGPLVLTEINSVPILS